MRVLYFMNHADEGGAALALYDLIENLKYHKDIIPIIITGKKNKLNKMLDDIGIENYYAPFKNFISSYKKPKQIFRILLLIRYIFCKPLACYLIEKKINFNDIDLIHTNLDRIDIGAYFSKKYSIPHIWHIREHLDDDFEVVSIFKNYIEHMEKYNSTYIAISNSVREKWISRGIPRKKIKLIYDGVKPNNLIKISHNYKDNMRIVFLGGYYKNKGQEFFIEALNKLPDKIRNDIQVDFYGNGNKSYVEYLENKVKKYNLTNVSLYGYDPNIYDKLNEYNVGINCSKAEGFGRITIEYMLAGICPLVSNAGANSELVEHKTTGYIYEYNNIYDLVNNLLEIYESVQCKRIEEICINARNNAKNKFLIDNHAQSIIKIYEEILDEEI